MAEIIGIFVVILIVAGCIGFLVVSATDSMTTGVMVFIICFFVASFSYLWYLNHTASGERLVKTSSSDLNGGLQRTVDVYDYNGKIIRQYKGRIDLKESNKAGETLFDVNGKRRTIDGGIVITEEK